jgi:hypothetical protein
MIILTAFFFAASDERKFFLVESIIKYPENMSVMQLVRGNVVLRLA